MCSSSLQREEKQCFTNIKAQKPILQSAVQCGFLSETELFLLQYVLCVANSNFHYFKWIAKNSTVYILLYSCSSCSCISWKAVQGATKMEGKPSVSQRLRRCAKNESFVLKSSTSSHEQSRKKSGSCAAETSTQFMQNLQLVWSLNIVLVK